MSGLHTLVTIMLVVMACIGAYMMAYFICISICEGFKKLRGGDDDDGDRDDTDD